MNESESESENENENENEHERKTRRVQPDKVKPAQLVSTPQDLESKLEPRASRTLKAKPRSARPAH
jgi:hypothetical protein